ncbi:DUF6221 family protein [Streptomyces sp. CC224B]|uniref:DUF6221 family protein n=1 Tax=Streptomyces sp. CC224B TaxID=3044571 RepID=UPI0024A8CCB4|nr:DUF6221 family protein [Streptomyces sp. CC224B]
MDLHAWITQQVEHTRLVALNATPQNWRDETSPEHGFRVGTADGAEWVAFTGAPDDDPKQPAADARHIAMHDPAAVLRRCEADRRILAIHYAINNGYDDPVCDGCGTAGIYDNWITENINDCPILLALAHAHGITDEILTELDRPQPPERKPATTGPLGLADVLAAPPITTSDVPAGLRGPRWKP